MLDRSLPFIGVIMIKKDVSKYPRYPLAKGYSFTGYRPGYGMEWARVQYELGHIEDHDEAVRYFEKEFMVDEDKLYNRCFFIQDEQGKAVATSSLWEGYTFGEPMQRVHWVAVHPDHQGKGLAKALMTRMLDAYHELGCRGDIYLTTQTWSYVAVNIYLKFGFEPYMGKRPLKWSGTDEDFDKNNPKAWDIIFEKIREYRK